MNDEELYQNPRAVLRAAADKARDQVVAEEANRVLAKLEKLAASGDFACTMVLPTDVAYNLRSRGLDVVRDDDADDGSEQVPYRISWN